MARRYDRHSLANLLTEEHEISSQDAYVLAGLMSDTRVDDDQHNHEIFATKEELQNSLEILKKDLIIKGLIGIATIPPIIWGVVKLVWLVWETLSQPTPP